MATTTPAPLDTNNVQGDILAGLLKKTQTYYFFQIDNVRVNDFRTQLAYFVPLITTTAQVVKDLERIVQNKKSHNSSLIVQDKDSHALPLLRMSGVNIAFSHKGLVKMGINDDIGDSTFTAGMLSGAEALGDPGTTESGTFSPDWIPAFKQDIHGMILVSGDSHATVEEKLIEIERIFSVRAHDALIHEVHRIVGNVRPGKEKGHEHFGFLDGISQPAIQGFDTNPNPGQETVSQGIILVGRDSVTRPAWALDGSFIALRYLFQLVPEFDTFLKQNPIPGSPPAEGSELLGARLVGRWKSGAPIDLAPTQDDPVLGANPARNNDFRYAFPDDPKTQDRCPFAAHTRKTNPRADLEDLDPSIPTEKQRIIRRGIQFGPEVTAAEAASGKTVRGRGLIFAAYQSNIANGFQFIQENWANNPGFPFQKPTVPGFDPIIGQATAPGLRTLSGTNPNSQSSTLSLPPWVVPRGGEYFFSPSISALKGTFALKGR